MTGAWSPTLVPPRPPHARIPRPSLQGRLLFMTTNHRELLDPALIRPGRVDVQEEFGRASWQQTYRLFRNFYAPRTDDPVADAAADAAWPTLDAHARAFADAIPPRAFSVASIQGHMIEYRRDPAAAVAAVGRLLGHVTAAVSPTVAATSSVPSAAVVEGAGRVRQRNSKRRG